MQPLTGLLSDRFGGRAFVVLGLCGTSIAGALVAWTPSLGSLVVALLLLGTANAVFHPQALAAVRRMSGSRAGSSLSVFLIGGEIGRGIWPLAASILVVHYGIGAIWVLALPAVFTVPMLWYAVPLVPRRAGNAAVIRWRSHAPQFAILVLFATLRGVALFSITTFVPLLWHQNGGSLEGGAGLITVLMLTGLIGNLTGGRLGDHGNRRSVIGTATLLALGAMVAFMLAHGLWLWILISVVGIGLFATFPLTILIGQDIIPENRSFGSGMALGFSNALAALGVMALGPLAGTWGISFALWAGVVSCAGALLVVPWLEGGRPSFVS